MVPTSFLLSLALVLAQVERTPLAPSPPALTGRVIAERDGLPIEGAELLVFFGDRAGRTTADARSKSDADGRFAIDFDASVRWFDLVVRAPHMSLREFTRWSRPADLEVKLWDCVSVVGAVTLKDGGTAPGAVVEIATPHEEFDGPLVATTGSDGRYHVTDVPIDARGMRVRSAGGDRETAVPFHVETMRRHTRDVVLDEGARVVVRVLDEAKRPIDGATVYAWTPDVPLGDALLKNRSRVGVVLTTAADGTAAIANVAPQELELAATAPGRAPAEITVAQTRTFGSIDVELVLPREAIATGFVRDGAGHAIDGARVDAWWFGHDDGDSPFSDARALSVAGGENEFDVTTATDAAGRFRLARLPPLPRGRVFASTAGGRRADVALPDLKPGASVDGLELVLDRIVRFTGRLLGPDGVPPKEGRAGYQRIEQDGRFVVETSDARTLSFSLSAPGLLPRRLVFDANCPDVLDVGDVTLEPGRSITGRVMDEHGLPIESAEVTVVGAEPDPVDGSVEVSGSARTGADGSFTVTGLPGALKSMSVRARGFASQQKFDFLDSTVIDVTLAPEGFTAMSVTTAIRSGAIAGRVIDASTKQPVYGFSLKVRATHPPECVPWLPSAPEIRDDAFRIPEVPVGDWRVIVVAPGYAPTFSDEVSVGDGATANVHDVALERGETLAIEATASAAGATVVVTPLENAPGPMLPASVVLDADGNGTFEHLAAGSYRLEGGSDVVAIGSGAVVEVKAGGEGRERLRAVAGGLVRLSRFRDCTPEPSWRYSLSSISGEPLRSGWIAQGAEVRHWLPVGRYSVSTDDPYGAPKEFEVVSGRAIDVDL